MNAVRIRGIARMKQLTDEQVKQVYINELVFLDDFCRKNNLEYYLAYGALMGAIRHKGFIPWDTDIDVFIPRTTAERLMQLVPKDSKYKITYREMCEGQHYPSRIYIEDTTTIVPASGVGVGLDGFIMDYIAKEDIRKRDFYENILMMKYGVHFRKGRSALKNVAVILGKVASHLMSNQFIVEQIKKSCTTREKAEMIRIPNKYPIIYSRFQAEWFKEKVQVEYEGKQYPAPAGYDAVLTQIYGDYMTPPPEWRKQRKIASREEVFER